MTRCTRWLSVWGKMWRRFRSSKQRRERVSQRAILCFWKVAELKTKEDGKCQRNSRESDILILEVRNSLSHASDSSNDVAMGDHDTLGDACGAAGVHDDGDVRGLWLSAVRCYSRDRGAEGWWLERKWITPSINIISCNKKFLWRNRRNKWMLFKQQRAMNGSEHFFCWAATNDRFHN